MVIGFLILLSGLMANSLAPSSPATSDHDLCVSVLRSWESLPSEQGWFQAASQADPAIAACSRIVSSSQETNSRVAVAYAARGIAYGAKQQLDRSVENCSQAIKLNPSYAEAFACRSLGY